MLEARLLLLIFAVAGEKLLCPLHVTENLNDGEKVGSAIVKDGIVFPRGTFFEYEGNLKGCVCNVTRCLRKCCPNGEAAVNNKCAPYEESFKIRTYVEDAFLDERPVDSFRLLHGNFCHVGKYKLNADFPSDRFYLQNNGIMYMPESDPTLLLPHEFCIEQFINTKTNKTDVTALVCFGDGNIIKKTRVYSLGMIISIPFLLATLFVYAVLPEKRNLHGKCLMSYVSSLMLAYCFLVFIQLNTDIINETPACTAIGVCCLFFFLVSFFWMNTMCTGIWLTFSGKRGSSNQKKDNRRFLLCALYACGVPFLLVFIVVVINNLIPSINQQAFYYPGFGQGQCWLHYGFPTLIYFYGPMSILITLNIVFFIITALKIQKVKKDTSILHRKDSQTHGTDDDKQQMFKLYIKLMMGMGVNWSMEIVSWAVIWANNNETPDEIWYLTDFCNALYGVFIFFIFVFKKKTWNSLKKRYYVFRGKPMQAHMESSQYQTAVSGLSVDDTDNRSASNLKPIMKK